MYYIYRAPDDINFEAEEGHIPITDDEAEVLVHCTTNSLRKNAVYRWKGELTKQGEVLESVRDKVKSLVPAEVIESSQVAVGE